MDIRHLRNFIQIAELGSLSAAARVLYVAQPALSQQIAQLEAELGQPLLVRRSTGVALTEQGTVFYQRAQRILKDLADLGSAVQEVAGRPRGRVALGLPQSTALQYAIPLLERSRALYPQIELEFFDELSGSLLNGVVSGRFDLAIVFLDEPAEMMALVDARPLLEETLYMVSHPAGAPPVDPVPVADLGRYPMALPGRGNGVRDLVEQAVRAQGGTLPAPHMTANSMSLMRHAVLTGQAHCIMPWAALPDELLAGTLLASPTEPPLVRCNAICTARDAAPTLAARAIAELLVSTISDSVRQGLWRGVRLL